MKKYGYGVLGFLLVFNLQFPPGLPQAIRAVDYIGVSVLLALIVFLITHGRLPRRLFLRAGLVVGVVGIWIAVSIVDGRSFVEPVRWLLALGYAFLGIKGLSANKTKTYILKGILLGAAGNLGVLLLQFLGFLSLTVQLGIAAPDVDVLNSVGGAWRPPGMYGTNGTSAVAVVCIPAAIALYESGTSTIWTVASSFGIVTATSAITLTRSSLLVAVVVLTIWGGLKANGIKQLGGVFLTVSLVMSAIAIFGPPGGWDRWEGASLQSENAQIRIRTTVASAELAMQNPTGFGRSGYQDRLVNRSGHSATHNAFTYLALSGGIPVAFTLIYYLVGRAATIFRQRDFVSWLALTLLGLFMWEELLRNPTFIAASILIILAGFSDRYPSFSIRP
ncbi:hypothetical protein [Salinibacter sp.]|uniref:hypothetical protein n=1 Tax=Salinibacter sp. TaxID=2065818 RepID=UPI0021E73572|nr:hypothetical protein [Salinibacter sp.]